MIHDPLCESRNLNDHPCYTCALIARVREDEATRAHRMSDAYRSALRDAVKAVKALHVDCYLCCKDKAVAAIEALNGDK